MPLKLTRSACHQLQSFTKSCTSSSLKLKKLYYCGKEKTSIFLNQAQNLKSGIAQGYKGKMWIAWKVGKVQDFLLQRAIDLVLYFRSFKKLHHRKRHFLISGFEQDRTWESPRTNDASISRSSLHPSQVSRVYCKYFLGCAAKTFCLHWLCAACEHVYNVS